MSFKAEFFNKRTKMGEYRFDVRKFWMTLCWITFFVDYILQMSMILSPDNVRLGIIAGKASLASGAYIANKKVDNGNHEQEISEMVQS